MLSGRDTTTPTALEYIDNMTIISYFNTTVVGLCIYFRGVAYRAGPVSSLPSQVQTGKYERLEKSLVR